jgi:hypothetical protein
MGDRTFNLANADTRNPFTPPSADLTQAAEGQEIRKPRSVWVVQVIGVALAVWSASGLILFIARAVPLQSTTRIGIPLWLQLIWQLLFLLALLVMLWQLPKRSRLGRLIGLGLIALFAIPVSLAEHGKHSQDPYYNAGGWFATFAMAAALLYWAYAFAFSEKARRYFSKAGHD